MWFQMDPTASVQQILHKISGKVRQSPWQWLDKCPGKIAWAVNRCLNGSSIQGRPKKVEAGEE
jgi:hypothetical protein